MCSHPRTGDATDEKIAETNREKFNELKFLRQNHELRQRVATQAIFAARWRRDNFKKIASPSQAKNRSCSRGLSDPRANPTRQIYKPRYARRAFSPPRFARNNGPSLTISVSLLSPSPLHPHPTRIYKLYR